MFTSLLHIPGIPIWFDVANKTLRIKNVQITWAATDPAVYGGAIIFPVAFLWPPGVVGCIGEETIAVLCIYEVTETQFKQKQQNLAAGHVHYVVKYIAIGRWR